MNSIRSSWIRYVNYFLLMVNLFAYFSGLAEFTEKLNAAIKKELRRRSDNANLRGFVEDDDEIGHLLASYYDLEKDQNSIVPVVQKKRICESVRNDISRKADAKLKLLQEQTAMLNLNISNIDKNLRNVCLNFSNRARFFVTCKLVRYIDQTKKVKFPLRLTDWKNLSISSLTKESTTQRDHVLHPEPHFIRLLLSMIKRVSLSWKSQDLNWMNIDIKSRCCWKNGTRKSPPRV